MWIIRIHMFIPVGSYKYSNITDADINRIIITKYNPTDSNRLFWGCQTNKIIKIRTLKLLDQIQVFFRTTIKLKFCTKQFILLTLNFFLKVP